MKKNYIAYIAVLLLAFVAAGCNDDESGATIVLDDSGGYSVIVNTFSLEKNDSVMANLDSVFFSIDLDRARIFNADSLPKGTKVSGLILKIGLPSVQEAKLIVPRSNGLRSDTIDYLTNSTDSVDFSNGPVTLHLVSANGEVSRDYEVSVNVHTVNPAIFTWSQTAQGTLPTTLSGVTAQGVVEKGGKVLCFTTDGSDFCRATSENIYAGEWAKESVVLPRDAQLEELTFVGEILYTIDGNGVLYSSNDEGSSWTATGSTMNHIVGVNGETLLGVKKGSDGSYSHVTYPASTETAVAEDFPVAETSQSLQFVTEWASDPMTFIVGGVTAGGEYTGGTWAYDGGEWAKVSNTEIPALAGVTFVPYFTTRLADNWQISDATAMLAIGGRSEDGTLSRKTYISRDRGVNWNESSYLEIPEEIEAFYGTEAVVDSHTLTAAGARSVSNWTARTLTMNVPSWYGAVTLPASRATTPITEWNCPFIYLFGGRNSAGTLNEKVWRGVINQLMFKPLQ